MPSEHIRNLLGGLADEAEEEVVPPLQLFLDWWSDHPQADPEDWERVAGAVDEEVESGYQALLEVIHAQPEEPFSRGLDLLERMRDQRGWPQSKRDRDEWLACYRELKQEAATWSGWSDQSLCSACGKANNDGWSHCQYCGHVLAVDEPVRDFKEVTPAGRLPPDLQRLLLAIAAWRQNGLEQPVLEQLAAMRARYQAAARQLRSLPELMTQFELAEQVVSDMATPPLTFEHLDCGYRNLCQHLAEANRLVAEARR